MAALAVYSSPAMVATCWAVFSKVPRVKRLMTLTAKINVLAVVVLFSFLYLTDFLCDGSALKGYLRCSLIPDLIANFAVLIFLIMVGVFSVWFLVAISLCIWAEFAAIRERNVDQ